ncbi:MAG TPA: M1 family aminopeptidase [Acidobacteriota bacterium]|nr:M1 family aminopeptidase [Acidobacteriota bacterium]
MYRPPLRINFLFPHLKALLVSWILIFSAALLLFSEEEQTDSGSDFYYSIQSAFQSQKVEDFLALSVSEQPDRTELHNFFENFLAYKARGPVMNLVEQKDDRLIVHVLLHGEQETAFQSWSFAIDQAEGKKRIRSAKITSSIDGLYQLSLPDQASHLQNIKMTHHDMTIFFEDGYLFVIQAGGVPAGVIFLGKGELLFKPSDPREQHQLVLFNKKDYLKVPLSQLFLRSSSSTLKNLFGNLDVKKELSNPKLFNKAKAISDVSNMNAFGVRLPYGDELWYPRLQGQDVYSELKTKAGDLVYQFAPNEVEDIMLIDSGRDRIISLYSSTGDYNQSAEIEQQQILSYKMKLSYNPLATYLTGDAEIRLLCKQPTNSVVFKLNPTLRVSRIYGSQGSLIYFQERNTNNLHVVLNEEIEEGEELTLRFRYQGRIEPDRGRAEVQKVSISRPEKNDSEYFVPPSYLYSNSAQWYPQLITRPYSPVKTVISVPSDYAAISNGKLEKVEKQGDRTVYSYSCDQPVKYFSLLVGRISSNFSFESVVPMNVFYYSIDKANAKQQAETADRILRFYENYFGKYPYTSLNLALRPSQELGGHAPATFVVANRVFTFVQSRFARDPLYVPDYPEFLLAHEIAHQWWGQAVGWRTYRDQWLSEGFAHFAAAEYIRSVYGDQGWMKLSRVFYSWVENKTKAGPLWLGSRLGHLTGDPQAFTALLYNKGAYILIMLKNWMGPKAFAECLEDFFKTYQNSKASIEDFRKIAQRHADASLGPFFDQWLSRWDIPQINWARSSSSAKSLTLRFQQLTDQPYLLKLPVVVKSSKGEVFKTDVLLNKSIQEVEITTPFAAARVEVDPMFENLARISQK